MRGECADVAHCHRRFEEQVVVKERFLDFTARVLVSQLQPCDLALKLLKSLLVIMSRLYNG